MNLQMQKLKYLLFMLSVTVIWGFGFIVVKQLLDNNAPVFFIIALRFLIGGLILLIMSRIFAKSKFTKEEIKWGIIIGIELFFCFASQTYGTSLTTPSKNGMLTGVYVIFVPIIMSIINKRLAIKPIIDAIICMFGMAVFFGIFSDNPSVNFGDVLSLMCAFGFAVHFILIDRKTTKMNSLNFTSIQLLTVALLAISVSLCFEIKSYKSIQGLPFVVGILFLGVLSTGYAYIVQTLTQRKLSSNTISIVASMESVFAVIFSMLFGFDKPTPSLIFGAIIIMIAIVSSVAISNQSPNNKLIESK